MIATSIGATSATPNATTTAIPVAATTAARTIAPSASSVAAHDTRHGAQLIYLMGASGSGKDTILRHVGARLLVDDAILIAHRYITRPSSADEISVELSETEFARRLERGCFSLHWNSHGLRYGIGIELDGWLARGNTVIVNGSRQHLMRALACYPELTAVEVTVNPDVLKARLLARGRELPDAIAQRLKQTSARFEWPSDANVISVDNNALPAEAAGALLSLARGLPRPHCV
jgi:ribose 1,5-bisphosphokinase